MKSSTHLSSYFTPRANVQATGQATLSHIRVPARTVLLVGCVVSVVLPAILVAPSASADVDLARMLRLMAVLKGGIAVASVAAVWWRVGAGIVSPRILFAYVSGTWLMLAASVVIWQLSHLIAAATLFHVGLGAVLLATWRDMPSSRANQPTASHRQ